jgi:hypothetical protein
MKNKKKGENEKIERDLDKPSTINYTILNKTIQSAKKDSRFAAWSTPGKAVLDYLANTTPKFSLSKNVALHLERGLKKEYPDLWDEVQKQLDGNTKVNDV